MAIESNSKLDATQFFAPKLLFALLFLLTLFVCGARAAAADIGVLIKQLDRTEWEIVRDEVGKRLPNLIAGEEEQAHFKRLLQSSQEMAAMAEALQAGDYQGLGSISANILARDLENMAARRFGKDSRLFQSIQLVKSDPELAKDLTRAALNADSDGAAQSIRKALVAYAAKEVKELRQQGEAFWKDMLRSIVPGSNALSKIGVDPVDLYLQGIRDWSDFTARTRLRFNNAMLDCLALRYRVIREQGGSHQDARLEIENFDTGTGIGRGFDCSKEMRRRSGQTGQPSLTQRLADFFRSTGRSTAALGELGLTSGEIVDLIEQYGGSSSKRRGEEFSEWLQDRLLRNIRARADGLMNDISESQKKAAREQLAEAERLISAIETEIAKLDRQESDTTTGPSPDAAGEPKPGVRNTESQLSQQDGDESEKSGEGKEEDEPEPAKVTVQCETLRAVVRKAERRVGRASAGEASTLESEITSALSAAKAEDNCPPDVYASADAAQARLQAASALRGRLQEAVRSCEIEELESYISQARSFGPSAFDDEITLLQTAQTGISHFKKGKALFDSGDYQEAKETLLRAQSALQELPAEACASHRERTQAGLENIEKIMSQQVIVDRAINACDVAKLNKIVSSYQNRKQPFFVNSIARIKAALPDCEEKERIIAEGEFCDRAQKSVEAASADFNANRLKAARKTLLSLKRELTESNTGRCPELISRVQRGLDNLKVLKAEYDRYAAAENKCDVGKLKKLAAYYRKKEHLWYRKASVRAKRAITHCIDKQKPTKAEAVADCRQRATAQDKVYGTTRYNSADGTYTCHYCAKGFVSNGSACIPDVAAAENDCRRQVAAAGKVYAKTEMRNDGSSTCHWCEPGHTYENGSCWSAAALAEANCRRDAARRGKVFARVEFLSNGQSRCHWCERGQIYATDGRCWTPEALTDAKCRHDVARLGKVYVRAIILANGQYRCLWCEPGMYYRNGRCYSPQQDIAQGVAAINGLIDQWQRTGNQRRPPTRRVTPQRRPQGGARPPPVCVKDGFINMTDQRCKSYW